MTHEEIIAMAREAGIEFQHHVGVLGIPNVTTMGSQKLEKIQRLIELAVAKEREVCQKIADDCADADMHASMAANAIRARGQKDGCRATLSASSSP